MFCSSNLLFAFEQLDCPHYWAELLSVTLPPLTSRLSSSAFDQAHPSVCLELMVQKATQPQLTNGFVHKKQKDAAFC